ncbi:MAG: hypothetical protein OEW75_11430 [Cyclobacteriaceae bacterium]|nr:hypothetical protein [Cyclobacteriaceae bacterium]
MTKFLPGDVILLKFPFQEDRSKFKQRPGVVIDVSDQDSKYFVAQITKTDHRAKGRVCKGILRDSDTGKKMKIKVNSFINLSNTSEIHEIDIIQKIGYCNIIDELVEMIKTNKIYPFEEL